MNQGFPGLNLCSRPATIGSVFVRRDFDRVGWADGSLGLGLAHLLLLVCKVVARQLGST